MNLRSTHGSSRLSACARVALAGLAVAGRAGAEPAPSEPAPAQGAAGEHRDDALIQRLKSRVARVGGLTAEEASRRAVATSNADRSQQAEVDVAESEVDRASVGYFPRVSLTARYARVSPLTPQPGLGALFPIIVDQYMLQAGVLLPLSDYILRIQQTRDAASESKEAALLTKEAVRRAVSARAKIQYYAWAAARMQQAVTEQSVEQSERHLEFAKAGRDTGRMPNVEVLRAESLLSSARLLDEHARNEALLAEAELRTMLHDPPGRTYEIGEDLLAPVDNDEPGEPEALFVEATQRRPDLRAFARTDGSLKNQRRVAEAAGAPRLDGFGNAYLANPNPRVLPPQEGWKATWDLGVQLTWSPNDFGTSGATARGLDARRRKVAAERASLADSVRDEISGSVLAWKESRAAAGTAQRGLEAAEEAYRVRSDLYELGRGTNVELIDSESDVLRARLSAIRARVDAKIARVRLEHAVGRDSLR
jgi:outer membrane protein TolC